MVLRKLLTAAAWLFWILLGIVLGMELSEWADRQRERIRPRALTGTLLDKVNESLEQRNRA